MREINGRPILTRDERMARRRRMAGMVEAGVPPREVAVKFGVCGLTVHSACREFGVPYLGACRTRAKRATTYQIIAALATTDDTQPEIAEQFGVSKQWVGQVAENCRKAGVPLHPGRRFKVERSENGRG